MVKFEELTGRFILSAIFLISMFSLIVVTQSSNNAPEKLIDNNVFNESMGSLITDIQEGTENANEKYNTFNSEEPKPGFGSIVLFGIVSVGKAFSQIIVGFFSSLIRLPLIILGIPENIYSLLSTWLIIITIVSAWLLYKLGG